MKLQFESNLEYQRDAINAVLDLFEGFPQLSKQNGFDIFNDAEQLTLDIPEAQSKTQQLSFNLEELKDLVISNPFFLNRNNREHLLANLHAIQEKNSVKKSNFIIEPDDGYFFPNFSVEMETGTGKTYVYLRTIFELNQKYGFSKFIIVVPTVAIREGVLSSLNLMREHFDGLYDKVPFDHFVYNSKDLSKVRQFAVNNQIQIMIINIQAFNKDQGNIEDYYQLSQEERKKLNIIHQEQDKMSGRRPIEFIQATHPIVIIDEPQSVDNGNNSKWAIKNLNPLFCLRYSATHINPYRLLYKLDPIRAYDLKLVKQIEVSSIQSEANFNQIFIRLDSISYPTNSNIPQATIIINDDNNGSPKQKQIKVRHGTNISQKTKHSVYDGYIVSNICADQGAEYIEFSNGVTLGLKQEIGGMREEVLKAQIYQTIEEHLKKEKRFQSQGIKVLSLFFVDVVANYRYYDDEGNPQKGNLAQWFEEAYQELIKKPLYQELINYPVEKVHDGYFSDDKKGRLRDSNERTNDEEIYQLIMRDKERLLSIDEPLRFIFSHSALKEGWDNPNVFQICTLREIGTDREHRQTLGRGLRLPVNQKGVRIYDESINKLTVIANESFEDYAKGLQRDIEKALGDDFKFGQIKEIAFAGLIDEDTDKIIGQEKSQEIWQTLVSNGYLDNEGNVTDKFNPEEIGFELELPPELQPLQGAISNEIQHYLFKNRVVNTRDRKTLTYNKHIELNEDFKILWDKIKQKTRYSVEFKTEELIKRAVEKISKMVTIEAIRITSEKSAMNIREAGIEKGAILATQSRTVRPFNTLPDILESLQQETELTRSTIVQILKQSKRLKEFTQNPQVFMVETAKLINRALREMVIDGIKYEQLQGQVYEMRLFEQQEIQSYLSNLYEVQSQDNRTPYDYVPFQYSVEKDIAEKLDTNENVKFFCKLPSWFAVPTPLGDYNPDWAIVLEDDEKLYLVRETKSTHYRDKRRNDENLKSDCGKVHFDALGIDYKIATNIQEVLSKSIH